MFASVFAMAPKSTAQRSKSYRERIKEDPEQYQRYLLKEKERYKNRKETGKLKCISQLSKREQRLQKRQWRINRRNKRAKEKQINNTEKYLSVNTRCGFREFRYGQNNESDWSKSFLLANERRHTVV